MSKRIVKVSIVTAAIMACLACFRFTFASIGDDVFGFLAEGLVGLLILGLQQLAVLIFGAIDVLTAAITGVTGRSSSKFRRHSIQSMCINIS